MAADPKPKLLCKLTGCGIVMQPAATQHRRRTQNRRYHPVCWKMLK